jgi:hypothetical protein
MLPLLPSFLAPFSLFLLAHVMGGWPSLSGEVEFPGSGFLFLSLYPPLDHELFSVLDIRHCRSPSSLLWSLVHTIFISI